MLMNRQIPNSSPKADMSAIIARLEKNEEITRKFHEIETHILMILNFRDLFEVLLSQIREKFKVPYAWISMIARSEVSALIQLLESSEDLREHLNIVDRESFTALVGTGMRPLLANENIKRYHKLLPEDHKYFIKSIAVAPISLDGEVIGSLNQADFSPRRFQPGIDASRLEQLAVKVSLCLSNVTAHEKLNYLAFHDALTGLLNRRVMETVLKREFYRAKRYADCLSVVFLDMDDFKEINDRYGHDQGDEVLKYVAKNLVEMSRDSDVVARFAGDEFVFVLPKTSAESAEALMERIKTQLETHPLIHEKLTIPISISFGVTSTENNRSDTPNQLLKKADEMLYQAKQKKKSGAGRGGD